MAPPSIMQMEEEPKKLYRVSIDRIRKDGLVFATDFSECDHSTKEARSVMFRPKDAEIVEVQYDSKDIKTGEKPGILKEGYGVGIEYGYEEKNFLHKIKRIYIIYKEPNTDWLLDL